MVAKTKNTINYMYIIQYCTYVAYCTCITGV